MGLEEVDSLQKKNGVTDRARTGDNQNHNLALYQLNYGHHNEVIL